MACWPSVTVWGDYPGLKSKSGTNQNGKEIEEGKKQPGDWSLCLSKECDYQ